MSAVKEQVRCHKSLLGCPVQVDEFFMSLTGKEIPDSPEIRSLLINLSFVKDRFVLTLNQLVAVIEADPVLYEHTPSLLSKVHSYIHGASHWCRVGLFACQILANTITRGFGIVIDDDNVPPLPSVSTILSVPSPRPNSRPCTGSPTIRPAAASPVTSSPTVATSPPAVSTSPTPDRRLTPCYCTCSLDPCPKGTKSCAQCPRRCALLAHGGSPSPPTVLVDSLEERLDTHLLAGVLRGCLAYACQHMPAQPWPTSLPRPVPPPARPSVLPAGLPTPPTHIPRRVLARALEGAMYAVFFHDVARATDDREPSHGRLGERVWRHFAQWVNTAHLRRERGEKDPVTLLVDPIPQCMVAAVSEAILFHVDHLGVDPLAGPLAIALCNGDRLDRTRLKIFDPEDLDGLPRPEFFYPDAATSVSLFGAAEGLLRLIDYQTGERILQITPNPGEVYPRPNRPPRP
ncbi:hypothetical protein PAPYR_2721 [Paratrimastix pyriformis]|uniref:Uncharacterized protein n=1 Tax=Paratrimastix pyriformis TaxID=342808 RepID=A0ABQ8UNY4_9EUKA|nr:hypothetical protein PAPYR_2721 [Paratrimastix pyriformis]